MIGASLKCFEKRSRSMVAEVMMTFRSGRRGSSVLRKPSRKSMFSERSWASSTMRVSYFSRKRSCWVSASRMPSVISLISVRSVLWSSKRT